MEEEEEATEVKEEEAAEVEAEEEEEAKEANLHLNKSSSLAKMKESWDNFPKYLTGTALKPKPSWRKSKVTFGLTPTSTDSIPP